MRDFGFLRVRREARKSASLSRPSKRSTYAEVFERKGGGRGRPATQLIVFAWVHVLIEHRPSSSAN